MAAYCIYICMLLIYKWTLHDEDLRSKMLVIKWVQMMDSMWASISSKLILHTLFKMYCTMLILKITQKTSANYFSEVFTWYRKVDPCSILLLEKIFLKEVLEVMFFISKMFYFFRDILYNESFSGLADYIHMLLCI